MPIPDAPERARRLARYKFLAGLWRKIGRAPAKFSARGDWYAVTKRDREVGGFGVEIVGITADFHFTSPFVFLTKATALEAAFDAVEPPAGLPVGTWHDGLTRVDRRTYVRLDADGKWVAVRPFNPNDYRAKTDTCAMPTGKAGDGTVPAWITSTAVYPTAVLPPPDGRDGCGLHG